MVKIRLRRTGSKKRPHYRVVVTPSRSPRDGRFIEIIGHYHPREDPPSLVVKEDRLFYWLSVGAQPSDSFSQIMRSKGIWEKYETFKTETLVDVSLVNDERSSAETSESSESASDATPSSDIDLTRGEQEMAEVTPALAEPEAA